MVKRKFGMRLAGGAMVFAVLGAAVTAAEASTISITATSISSGNFLGYTGLGQLGSPFPAGIGTGTYQIGSCAFNAGANQTECVVMGAYVETAASGFTPGGTGTFTFREVWQGNIANPVIARSATAGSNSGGLHAMPGAFFDLTLSNGFYGQFDPNNIGPANPFTGALNWQAFLSNASCTGNPSTCSYGVVGVEPGTAISGNLSPFNMQIAFTVDPVPVPEPGTLVLFGTGAALLAAGLRRRARA